MDSPRYLGERGGMGVLRAFSAERWQSRYVFHSDDIPNALDIQVSARCYIETLENEKELNEIAIRIEKIIK